jgi:hypothetical protein
LGWYVKRRLKICPIPFPFLLPSTFIPSAHIPLGCCRHFLTNYQLWFGENVRRRRKEEEGGGVGRRLVPIKKEWEGEDMKRMYVCVLWSDHYDLGFQIWISNGKDQEWMDGWNN